MIEVTYLNIGEFTPDTYRTAYEKLSPSRKMKADGYRLENDKKLCVGAGILLSRALEKIGLTERSAEFVLGKHGKPRLKNGEFCFNLSHSGEIVCLAVSDCEVGVDVQRIEAVKEKLIPRIFTPAEREWLDGTQDRETGFYRLWTAKESVVKYLGTGITELSKIEIDLTPPAKIKKEGKLLALFLKEYSLDRYRLTICAEENKFALLKKSV